MKEFFFQIFEYNHQINQQLIAAFLQHKEQVSGRPLELLNHIMNAHQVWNNRISDQEVVYGVWDMHDTDTLAAIDQKNHDESLQILGDRELNTVVEYSNSRGQVFHKSIRDMLFHVVNHGTYHRGQIAMEFRRAGVQPLITDYIFYVK